MEDYQYSFDYFFLIILLSVTYNKKCSSQKGESVFFLTEVWFFWGGSSISTTQNGSAQPWLPPNWAARITLTKSRFSPCN